MEALASSSSPASMTHGDCEDRLRALSIKLDSAKSLFPGREINLRLERAMLLTHLGRTLEARSDHLRVLELDETHRGNLLDLGRLLVNTGQSSAARVVYAKAVEYYPDDIICLVNLGSAILALNDPEGARQQYEAALRIDPNLPEAHGGMYYALKRLGEREAAESHRQKGFGAKNLFRSPYRGEAPPVPILLLVSSTGGNTPIEKLLDETVFQTYVVVADFFNASTPLPDHQLIFNGICDVEVASDALYAAESLLLCSPAPVLNRPSSILATSRCENALRMANLPGVRTPKTMLYPYALLAGDEGPPELANDGFVYPLLLRVPGFHMGDHFIEVSDASMLAAQVASLPGAGQPDASLLAIEYLNARGPDGCARKYRAIFVDGKIYPLHLAISAHWKIHYFSADMADRPDHRDEEAAFLADMPSFLGPKAMAGLQAIHDILDLDYGGIDFGLTAHGEVLLFEANAAMVVEEPAADARWDYRRKAVQRIHSAVRAMLLKNVLPR